MRLWLPALFARIGLAVTAMPRIAGAVYLVAFFSLFAGVATLGVDFSARAYYGGESQTYHDLVAFEKRWGADDDSLLVVLRAQDGDFYSPERVEAVAGLSARLAKLDGVRQVLDYTRIQLPSMEGGTLSLSTVFDIRQKADLQQRIRADELLTPAFVAADGRSALVVVRIVNDDNIAKIRPIVDAVRGVVDDAQLAGVELSTSGLVALRASLLELILEDQLAFVPCAFLLMALLLFLMYRRFHGVFLPLLVAALPAAVVMGIMGYSGEPIGVVNQVYFTLLPVIAVSGGIHLLSRYYEEAHRIGLKDGTLLPLNKARAAVLALRSVGGACFFSALTTMVGLLSLQLSSMPVLRSFGFYSAVGVAFAFFTLVVLVPSVLSITRGRVVDRDREQRRRHIDVLLGRCADLSLERPHLAFAVSLAVFAISAGLATSVVVDNSLGGMLPVGHKVRNAGEHVDANLGGLLQLEVSVDGAAGTFVDPAVLKTLWAFEQFALEEEAVLTAAGPGRLIRRLHGLFSDSDEAFPEDPATVAQLLFLVDDHQAVAETLNADRSAARIVLRVKDIGARRFSALTERLEHRFHEQIDKDGHQATLHLALTGTARAIYDGVHQLAADLAQSVALAFFIVLIVIIGIFRSIRVGLLVILPNGLPIVMGAALLALLGWNLEPGPAVVFTIALGIAVDDTIHLLVRCREEQALGACVKDAMRIAVVRSGRPVIITTVILCAGFLVNALSAFPTNSRVGVLGAFVIFSALLADIFVLPALVSLFAREDTLLKSVMHDDTEREPSASA